MKFVDSLPVDSGASDCLDSARLAGLLALTKHLQAPDLTRYLINGEPVRHPTGDKANDPAKFSRDQLIPFVAGLWAQGKIAECKVIYETAKRNLNHAPNHLEDDGQEKLTGGDYLLPHVMNHLKLCAGLKGSWWGYLWLRLDIWFNSTFTALREPNQLAAMCLVAGKKYVDIYKKDSVWKTAFQLYWKLSYRNEPEICEHFTNYIEGFV